MDNVGECALVVRTRENRGVTNLATTQAQKEGYELAHCNICPICNLLEHRKEHILQINKQKQNCRISMTQDNSKILKRNPGEGAVLMM